MHYRNGRDSLHVDDLAELVKEKGLDKRPAPKPTGVAAVLAQAIGALLLVLAFGSLSFAQALPDQVDEGEVRRLGNVVQHVGAGPRSDGSDEFMEAVAPPASDADKWFVSIVTSKSCPACNRLKADWQASPDLKAWAVPGDAKTSWAHYNEYNGGDRSQAFRFTGIKIEGYPTILVQPPRTGKFGDPKTVVCQITGYGNAAGLANRMSANVRAYTAKIRPIASRPLPGARAPALGPGGMVSGWRQPAPFNPNDLIPTPLMPSPLGPPPQVNPQPVAPDAPEPAQTDAIPATQELVVVMDDAGLDPSVHTRIRELADRWKKGTRVRYLDFATAKLRYPVKRDETPVVLATSDGRIEDKVSARLLPLLMPQLSISDLPWTSLLTLLGGGASLPVFVGIGIWAIGRVRAARQAAGQTVLPQQMYDELTKLLQNLSGAKASAEALKPMTLEVSEDPRLDRIEKALEGLASRLGPSPQDPPARS